MYFGCCLLLIYFTRKYWLFKPKKRDSSWGWIPILATHATYILLGFVTRSIYARYILP